MGRGFIHLKSKGDWESLCACSVCEKVYWGEDKAIACCKKAKAKK